MGWLTQGGQPGFSPMPTGTRLTDVPLYRQPFATEAQFFDQSPQVAGMATEDGKVILNPYSPLSENGRLSVFENEKARLALRGMNLPRFSLTPEQSERFARYGSPTDQRHTVLARLRAGDPSAGAPTFMQSQLAEVLRSALDGWPR